MPGMTGGLLLTVSRLKLSSELMTAIWFPVTVSIPLMRKGGVVLAAMASIMGSNPPPLPLPPLPLNLPPLAMYNRVNIFNCLLDSMTIIYLMLIN